MSHNPVCYVCGLTFRCFRTEEYYELSQWLKYGVLELNNYKIRFKKYLYEDDIGTDEGFILDAPLPQGLQKILKVSKYKYKQVKLSIEENKTVFLSTGYQCCHVACQEEKSPNIRVREVIKNIDDEDAFIDKYKDNNIKKFLKNPSPDKELCLTEPIYPTRCCNICGLDFKLGEDKGVWRTFGIWKYKRLKDGSEFDIFLKYQAEDREDWFSHPFLVCNEDLLRTQGLEISEIKGVKNESGKFYVDHPDTFHHLACEHLDVAPPATRECYTKIVLKKEKDRINRAPPAIYDYDDFSVTDPPMFEILNTIKTTAQEVQTSYGDLFDRLFANTDFMQKFQSNQEHNVKALYAWANFKPDDPAPIECTSEMELIDKIVKGVNKIVSLYQFAFRLNPETKKCDDLYFLMRLIYDLHQEVKFKQAFDINTSTIRFRSSIESKPKNASMSIKKDKIQHDQALYTEYHGQYENKRIAILKYLIDGLPAETRIFDEFENFVSLIQHVNKNKDRTNRLMSSWLQDRLYETLTDILNSFKSTKQYTTPWLIYNERDWEKVLTRSSDRNRDLVHLSQLSYIMKELGDKTLKDVSEYLTNPERLPKEKEETLRTYLTKNISSLSRSMSTIILRKTHNYYIESIVDKRSIRNARCVLGWAKTFKTTDLDSYDAPIDKEHLIPVFNPDKDLLDSSVKLWIHDRDNVCKVMKLSQNGQWRLIRRNGQTKLLNHKVRVSMYHGDHLRHSNKHEPLLTYFDPPGTTGPRYVKHINKPVTLDIVLNEMDKIRIGLTKDIIDVVEELKSIKGIQSGGMKQYVKYKGRRYVVRLGKRGGSYIVANGRKVYMTGKSVV